MTDITVDTEALIIGTGFGGMGAAIQLKKLGYDSIMMLDRESDLGGTWHINKYPGLAVDIPSVSYSYSFEPNPYWSRRYCPGEEIRKYAHHVADKYGLRKFMRFNTTVKRADFDAHNNVWTVFPENGAPITARLLLLATGFLSQPKMPDIPGIESFAGKVIHTAAWDHDYDMTGTRAAMIGTGASAVQVLPIIAEQAAHMDVYQRTPIWVTPKSNPRISKRLQNIYARIPLVQRAARFVFDTALETALVTAVLNAKRWPFMARSAEKACRAHLERQVPDPDLRAKLTPDYSFGCKRPTFANDYYPTFMRDDVELVTEGIDHIEPNAIIAKDGTRREIDTLVLATGFNVWERGNFPAFEVRGTHGRELGEWWRQNRFQSYEGITVPGFPNLFNLHSPFSYSGFCYFNTIEIQMKHMDRCLKAMRKQGATRIEVKEDAKDRFMEEMWAKQDSTMFATGNCATANSYYFNPHGEQSLLRLSSARKAMKRAGSFPLSAYSFG